LPANTRWITIEGGNHAQFGWYGDQSGDLPATISHLEQQQIIIEATLELLKALGGIQTSINPSNPVVSISYPYPNRIMP
jgi:hypothetical protein